MSIQINESNFESEVIKSDVPVLVDFWAPWCGPCMMMADLVEEIATETQGFAKVCKINVDDNQKLAVEYGIMSIPNFMVFKKGEATGQTIGATSKESLLELLK